jgi:hypothetical protein
MQNHAKRRNKLKKQRKHIDIDYLRDDSLVLFVHLNGSDHSLIDYAKGSKILEYKDTELVGVDVVNLLPRKYRYLHRGGSLFKHFHKPFDQGNLTGKIGTAMFLNKRGYLVMLQIKIRLIIDATGEIFIVILGRVVGNETRFALYNKETITDMSEDFEATLISDFGYHVDAITKL